MTESQSSMWEEDRDDAFGGHTEPDNEPDNEPEPDTSSDKEDSDA